ncbi:MAG: HlyD family secretion protein, partial [Thermoanaerobaculia bacterium]|nr:HlyD family secretion protein [Thermoanaerobaculia bacterium]
TGQTFKGVVRQVRLQSTTTDNVVNYTVVVSVPNTDGKLLPGMTARVQFLTRQSDNVLKVSNSALRYKPTDAELAALKASRQATTTSTAATSTTTSARSGRNGGTRTGSSNFGTLYYLDANGKLAVARVKTGINDGSTTEVTGKTIKEGMKVIAGTITPTTTAAATSTAPATPFQGGQQQGGAQRGGGRGGF